jgi:hypothetical protein
MSPIPICGNWTYPCGTLVRLSRAAFFFQFGLACRTDNPAPGANHPGPERRDRDLTGPRVGVEDRRMMACPA